MSDPTWRTRSGSRRRSERPPPDSEERRAAEAQVDDWQWDEIDWSQETEHASPESVPASQTAGDARGSTRIGLIPAADRAAGGQPSVRAGRFALIRRRRMAALALLGLLFASAIIVPLVVFDSGQNVVEQTTALTTTAPPATTAEQPATTTTPQGEASGATPLRIALPENGTLRRGDRGSAVEKLQKALTAIGYEPGEPDGVFGQLTQAAVIDFQRSNNLAPDGVVGADTARTLNTALARRGVTE